MSLQKDYNLYNSFIKNYSSQVILIEVDRTIFYKKYEHPKKFFRYLKNGMYSLNRITNRTYFKNVSGLYLTFEDSLKVSILIFCDISKGELNELQVKIRVGKLLGPSVNVSFPKSDDYSELVKQVFLYSRQVQPFGEYYFSSSSILSNRSTLI